MRILFFNYEYPPIGAGAANATFCILREYVKMPELKVDLITSSATDKYVLDKISDNIKVHRLPVGKNENNLHFQSRKNMILYSIKSYFFARKLIKAGKKEGYSYNLTHSFFTVPCGFVSMILKFNFKLPYIVSLRGSDVPGYSDRFTFIYKFITPIIRLIWKNAFFVIANSQGFKKLAKKTETKKDIGIIYNGVEINHFKPSIPQESKDKFIITIGASRITHRKGINYLIEAIAKISPKYPNVYAKLMGEGNAKEDLEKLVSRLKLNEKIEFLGRIPREKTAPYYNEASVFVLPSLNEGMSNAMLEAMASGLAVIMTLTGGAEELIKEGVNGFIVKFKDSDDIARKLEKLINNPELCQSMGQESRKIAENMSWEKVANQYFDLYCKIKKLTS
jgi:glycosyltransferase involved in cell wall biosynthesis